MTSSRSLLLLIAALAAGAALTQARASPLDADTCSKMMVEQGALETAGVEQDLAKGPEWAKAHLSPEKIAQIRRFIELEELILFRCRSKLRVVLPPDPEEQEAKDKEAKDKEAKDKEAKYKEAKDKEAKDGQGKGAADKQETVLTKTAPLTAKPKEPDPSVKSDVKKQKTQEKQKPGKTVAKPGAEPKANAKAQPKAASEKDRSGAKAQAKAAPQQAPKTGAAPQKSPPKAKAKAEVTPKDEPPPNANPLGGPFSETAK